MHIYVYLYPTVEDRSGDIAPKCRRKFYNSFSLTPSLDMKTKRIGGLIVYNISSSIMCRTDDPDNPHFKLDIVEYILYHTS